MTSGSSYRPVKPGDREALDSAYERWVQAQQAAIEVVRQAFGVPDNVIDLAEGYRWVTRLASLAQEWFVEKADPLHPQLFKLQDEYRKLLVDNPDVCYRMAVLDDGRRYRLFGKRGDAAYVGLTFGTPIGKGAVGGRTGTTLQLHLDQFELGPDGEVDILMGPEGAFPGPATGSAPLNTIALPPGTGQLAVRETYWDRRHDAQAELAVELVDQVAPPVLDPETLAGQLDFAALFLQFVTATALDMWRATEGNRNSLGGTSGAHHVEAQEDEVRSHSDADMTYHGGRFALGENEALVITVEPPATDFLYWGLTLSSPWMESYDYRYTVTSLNNRQAARDDDGRWRLVISPGDPGVPNWLDITGRREGYMIVRWVLAEDPPHPACEVVPLDRLRSSGRG